MNGKDTEQIINGNGKKVDVFDVSLLISFCQL